MSAAAIQMREQPMDVPRVGGTLRRRRYLAWAATLAVVVALASAMLWSVEPTWPVVERTALVIATVKSGSLVRQVRAPGLLSAEDQRWLTTRTSGRMESVLQRA